MFKFDNIGNNIKGLAKGIFILEVILAIISGVVSVVLMFVQAVEYGEIGFVFLALLMPIAVLLAIILAWVSVWLLYGFGELVQSNTAIADKLCNYQGK